MSIATSRPSASHAHPRVDDMIAGLAVGGEGFEAVGRELDRARQQLRDRGHRQLLAVNVDLQSESAADVRRDHAHPVFGNPEMAAIDVLHLEGRLMGLVNGQPFLHRIPLRDDGPPLERDGGMAAELEPVFDDMGHIVKRGSGIAVFDFVLKTQIVAEVGMNDRACGRKRSLHVGDDGELLPFDHHEFRRILRRGPARGDDGDDGLALEAGAVDRHDMLDRGLVAGAVRGHGMHRLADVREIGAGDDADHAVRRQSRGRVDAQNPRMAIGAPHERHMQHVRDRDVVRITAPAVNQAAHVRARDPLADKGVGTESPVARTAHAAGRAFEAASTASTMAW